MFSKSTLYLVIMLSILSSCVSDSAVKNSPDDIIAQAQDYYDRKKFNEAIELLEIIIQDDSLNYEAIYFRAGCNFFLKKHDDTIQDLLIVAETGYREYDVNYNIGNTYWILAEYSNAVKYFKKALILGPNNQEVKDIIEVLEEAVEIFEDPKNIY